MSRPGSLNNLRRIQKNLKNCRCIEKERYPTVCGAIRAADTYNSEIALVLSPMTPYYCRLHCCFHNGHDNKMSSAEAIKFLKDSRGRYLNDKYRGGDFE